MTLPRSIFALQFLKGLRTNTDPHLQLDGELSRLDNAQVNRQGAISKRLGFDALPRNTFAGSILTQGNALASFGEELLLFDGMSASAYSPALSQWIDRGVARSVIVDGETIIRNDGYQQTSPTTAVLGNLEVHAWLDERGGARYSLIDLITRSRIVADASLSATATIVKAFAFGGRFVLIYSEPTTSHKFKTIDSSGALSSSTTIASNINLGLFDACVSTSGATSKLFVATSQTTPNNAHTYTIDSSFAVAGPLLVSASNLGMVCCFPDASGRVWVANGGTSNNIQNYLVNFANSATVVSINTLFTRNASTLEPYRLCGYADDGYVAHFYVEHAPALSYNESIWTNTCNASGTRGTATILARSVGIFSKPWRYGDAWFMGAAHESDEQATCFVLALSDGSVVAKLGYTLSGGLEAIRVATEVATLADGVYAFDTLFKGRDLSSDGFFFTRLGVKGYQLDFTSPNAFGSTRIEDQLVVVGGIVQSYDKSQLIESNFHLYPENVSAVASNSTGALTNLGVYQYKVVCVATDAAGNVHESRPSTPLSITMGAADDTVALTIPTLRLTSRPTGTRLDVYRTKNAGSQFHKITSSITPLYNRTDVDSVSFIDTLPDTSLDALPLLYTSGEIANSSPPNAKLNATWASRLFLAGTEEANEIWMSKLSTPGIAAEMVDDDAFKLSIDPVGGAFTALMPLDNSICIFRESAIYAYTGEGPDNGGTAASFSTTGVPSPTPTAISSSIGCGFPGVVADIPAGLIFASLNGIHLLGRDKTLSYIGDAVQAYNDGYTFSSVDRIPQTTQVRFTTVQGPCLVYDYFYEMWQVWNTLPAVDAAIHDNKHALLTSDGYVLVQGSGFQDAGANYDVVASTSWYFPAGLQGQCILDSVFLTGEYLSSHSLTIDISIDNVETPKRTFTISAPNMATIQYPVVIYPRLRCESFKLTMTATGSGACANWAGLRAEIATVPGSNRNAPRRRSSS